MASQVLAKENAALRELAESQGARITQLEGKLEAVMRTVSKLANDSMMVRGRAEGEWSFDDSPPLHDDAAACTITLCGGQVEVHGQVQGIGTEEIEQWMLEQQQISQDCGHLAQFNPARPELRLDAAVSECGAIQFNGPGRHQCVSQAQFRAFVAGRLGEGGGWIELGGVRQRIGGRTQLW